MSHGITRHFATIDGRWGPRQVHYRRAGTGPAVLLLHQSPQSSAEMAGLMQRWAGHFTLIAPDTPGYGQSDPLGPASSIEDFATALGEFVDAIGLTRFGIYGYHTGASIGAWLAARHAARVSALAANGLAQFTDAERAPILGRYLPPVVPAWDGSHLAWMWARVREQTVFFPWHERSAASRLALDLPSPERLQASLLEFLRAGDHYAVAYRAAFESRPETILPSLTVPLLVTAAARDPLATHFTRYRDLAPQTRVVPAATPDDALEHALHHLLAHRGDPAPAAVATRPIAGRLWNTFLGTDRGQARVRLDLAGRGEPLLLLHDAAGSAEGAQRLVSGLLGTRPLVIPDLPGHGESDPVPGTTGPTVSDCADDASLLLGRLGLSEAVLAGEGAGACIAVDLARRSPRQRQRLALLDLPWLPEPQRSQYLAHGLVEIEPQWHGGHLLQAWHMLRDARLFFPWYERAHRAARAGEPDLDERRLQLELRDLLTSARAWVALRGDALGYPIADALGRVQGRSVALGAPPASAWREATRAVSSAAGLACRDLPDAREGWLPALLDS